MSSVRIVNNLPAFVSATQRRGLAAMTQALSAGMGESSVLTPIDSSNLLNSMYQDVQQDGSTIRGRVGYTAEYAEPVHDPDNPQRFRRASAEKEFLRKGFDAAEPTIARVFREALKT